MRKNRQLQNAQRSKCRRNNVSQCERGKELIVNASQGCPAQLTLGLALVAAALTLSTPNFVKLFWRILKF